MVKSQFKTQDRDAARGGGQGGIPRFPEMSNLLTNFAF